ncbi:MAG: prepilin-type N-terminal cleavage/methylation domain-containing protein [Terriglobia bacterium]
MNPIRYVLGHKRGFTLIEVMLAMTILGLVLVMLAESFHAVVGSKAEAENWLIVNQQARAALWEMSNEVRGAVQTPMVASNVLFLGQAQIRNGVPMDSLSVSTLDPGHRHTLEDYGPEEIVTYSSQPNPEHPGWSLLLRQQYSGLLVNATAHGTPMVVANNLLSLHIRYFDGQNWTESWDSSKLPPGHQLPQEVQISLVMASPGGRPWALSTQISLPMSFAQW